METEVTAHVSGKSPSTPGSSIFGLEWQENQYHSVLGCHGGHRWQLLMKTMVCTTDLKRPLSKDLDPWTL